jgi:cytochrome P450
MTLTLRVSCSITWYHSQLRNSKLTGQIAGSDTTANTLTYLLHELSRPQNHSYQERLHHEVISLGSTSPSLSDIDKLPVVDAVLREGLRVFSAIPFLEPREVPKGGRLLHNFYLPEQVSIPISHLSSVDNGGHASIYPPSRRISLR